MELERRDQGDIALATSADAGQERGSVLREKRPAEWMRQVRSTAEESGLRVERRFTAGPGGAVDPYSTVEWDRRTTRITNPDGAVVFEMKDIEVPRSWSQVAGDILASKYLRKAGVPVRDASGKQVLDEKGQPRTTNESCARQVVYRLVGCWRYWGEK